RDDDAREESRRRRQRGAIGGGAGRRGDEDAPMGLFEVARGAAAALSQSAFPLRAGRSAGLGGAGAGAGDATRHVRDLSGASWSGDEGGGGGAANGPGEGGGRVRKRDMVASAVTGGLASGLGWVLGATPAMQPAGGGGRGGDGDSSSGDSA
ncbi:hypothetical protein LTR28_013929, partial [Elasticomyces elasticus]